MCCFAAVWWCMVRWRSQKLENDFDFGMQLGTNRWLKKNLVGWNSVEGFFSSVSWLPDNLCGNIRVVSWVEQSQLLLAPSLSLFMQLLNLALHDSKADKTHTWYILFKDFRLLLFLVDCSHSSWCFYGENRGFPFFHRLLGCVRTDAGPSGPLYWRFGLHWNL